MCIANQLTGFYMLQFFTEMFIGTDVNILTYVRCFEIIQNNMWCAFSILFVLCKLVN